MPRGALVPLCVVLLIPDVVIIVTLLGALVLLRVAPVLLLSRVDPARAAHGRRLDPDANVLAARGGTGILEAGHCKYYLRPRW